MYPSPPSILVSAGTSTNSRIQANMKLILVLTSQEMYQRSSEWGREAQLCAGCFTFILYRCRWCQKVVFLELVFLNGFLVIHGYDSSLPSSCPACGMCSWNICWMKAAVQELTVGIYCCLRTLFVLGNKVYVIVFRPLSLEGMPWLWVVHGFGKESRNHTEWLQLSMMVTKMPRGRAPQMPSERAVMGRRQQNWISGHPPSEYPCWGLVQNGGKGQREDLSSEQSFRPLSLASLENIKAEAWWLKHGQ